jgi:hypothetical protein
MVLEAVRCLGAFMVLPKHPRGGPPVKQLRRTYRPRSRPRKWTPVQSRCHRQERKDRVWACEGRLTGLDLDADHFIHRDQVPQAFTAIVRAFLDVLR